MTDTNLLIIHQGALGDFIAIFPAIDLLSDRLNHVDVICQSQLGKLAQYLGLAARWYPLEGAAFSSLYSDQPDPEITTRLRSYDQVILFSSSTALEKSLQGIMPSKCVRIEPKPPVTQSIHITDYALQNLIRCGLIQPGPPGRNRLHRKQFGKQNSTPRRDSTKILLHAGSGSFK